MSYSTSRALEYDSPQQQLESLMGQLHTQMQKSKSAFSPHHLGQSAGRSPSRSWPESLSPQHLGQQKFDQQLLTSSEAQGAANVLRESSKGWQEVMEQHFGKQNESIRALMIELGSQQRDMIREMLEGRQHQGEKPTRSKAFDTHTAYKEQILQVPRSEQSLVGDRQNAEGFTTQFSESRGTDESDQPEIGARRSRISSLEMTAQKTDLAESHWELNELDGPEMTHSWFELAFQRKVERQSAWHHLLEYVFPKHHLLTECPDNKLVDMVSSRSFELLVMFGALVYTFLVTWGAHLRLCGALSDPPKENVGGWALMEHLFMGLFSAEVLLRLVAYRTWFFLSPDDWVWNLFDLSLITLAWTTTLTEWILKATIMMDFNFARVLRLLRVFRMLKMVRIIKFFVELRKLLYAVVACMSSLFWAIVFLAMIMLLFSLFMMSALLIHIEKVQQDPELLEAARMNFDGLGECFITLFSIVAGPDWVPAYRSLSELGSLESLIMPLFVLFVQVGIMNILIGVYAEASQRCPEIELIAQDQIEKVEDFVDAMLDVCGYVNDSSKHLFNWDDFQEHFQKENVQAYLESHELDISRAHLIFSLCDRDKTGDVDIREFVLGLLRLKGLSKALDSKVMCHALSAMQYELDAMRSDISLGLGKQTAIDRPSPVSVIGPSPSKETTVDTPLAGVVKFDSSAANSEFHEAASTARSNEFPDDPASTQEFSDGQCDSEPEVYAAASAREFPKPRVLVSANNSIQAMSRENSRVSRENSRWI